MDRLGFVFFPVVTDHKGNKLIVVIWVAYILQHICSRQPLLYWRDIAVTMVR